MQEKSRISFSNMRVLNLGRSVCRSRIRVAKDTGSCPNRSLLAGPCFIHCGCKHNKWIAPYWSIETQAPLLTCPNGEDRQLLDVWHGRRTPGCTSHLNLSSRYDSETGVRWPSGWPYSRKRLCRNTITSDGTGCAEGVVFCTERLRVRCVHCRGVISPGMAIAVTTAGTRHALASMCVMQDRVYIGKVGGLDRHSSVLVQSESLWHNNNRNCRLLVYTAGSIKDFRSPFFVRY